MSLQISNSKMSTPDSCHVAVPVNGTSWKVTWLDEDRRLTRNQAITAMTIAETVGYADSREDLTPYRRLLDAWSAELGLAADTVINWAARPPRWELPA